MLFVSHLETKNKLVRSIVTVFKNTDTPNPRRTGSPSQGRGAAEPHRENHGHTNLPAPSKARPSHCLLKAQQVLKSSR